MSMHAYVCHVMCVFMDIHTHPCACMYHTYVIFVILMATINISINVSKLFLRFLYCLFSLAYSLNETCQIKPLHGVHIICDIRTPYTRKFLGDLIIF